MTKVLIVDDEIAILQSTAALLESLGYEVATCASVPDVLDAITRERPDILLQDLRMPGLDIERHATALRAHPRAGSFVVVLFSAGMELQEIAGRVGIAHTLEKPFKPHELLGVLEACAAPAPPA